MCKSRARFALGLRPSSETSARASSSIIMLRLSRYFLCSGRATQARARKAVVSSIRTCTRLREDRTKTDATFTEATVATDRLGLQQPMKQEAGRRSTRQASIAHDPELRIGSEQCVRRTDMVNHQAVLLSGHASRIPGVEVYEPLCYLSDQTRPGCANCIKPRATLSIRFRRC